MTPIKFVTPPIAANAFLLKEDGILIDAGGDAAFLLKAIEKYMDPKDLNYVFLTHSHFDHAKAADVVQRIGAKVVMHSKEYEFASLNASPLYVPVKPDVTVEGGEVFEFDNVRLEVIHTPGHTPGSICLYEPDRKWLFSGDTVFAYGGFGRVDFPGGDARSLIESLKKLSELEVKRLYPGHEDVVEDGKHVKKAYEIARRVLI
ncbi:MBL fold metallo-hydrolase [Archaeoglobus veneficus]|uniref:Beta-lactamase domain protein n=1 Tax=Archaeoglobus veneficus (strain DSM 11195 / SNP6) TaxID=693661 RepID=F2KRU6_ARCVS|nr:MBL fold metallo-hydrolase [Archaeoglobus veneficus]AEA47960.1 beta-lactamase domain protein [Archaeoglobus veneficus SNP6]